MDRIFSSLFTDDHVSTGKGRNPFDASMAFRHSVLTILFLDLILSLLCQDPPGKIIIQAALLGIVALMIRAMGRKGYDRALLSAFAPFLINLLPFIHLLVSYLVFDYEYTLQIYNHLGTSIVLILSTQFLNDKKLFRTVLAAVAAGWIIFFMTELTTLLWVDNLESESLLWDRRLHLIRYGYLICAVIISALLAYLNLLFQEQQKEHLSDRDRAMNFLIQKGKVGLFVLDSMNDSVRGNAIFFQHLAKPDRDGAVPFLSLICPLLQGDDRKKLGDLIHRIENNLPLDFPMEVPLHMGDDLIRWIRFDGELIEDKPGSKFFLGSTLDIDRLKKSETKARAAAAAVKASLMAGEVSIWEMDLEQEVFNLGENSFLSPEDGENYRENRIRPFSAFIENLYPQDRERVKKQFDLLKEGSKNRFNITYLFNREGSDTFTWFKDFGVVSSWDSWGKPLKVSGYTMNIDRDKRESIKTDRALRGSGYIPWTWNISENIGELDKDYQYLLGVELTSRFFTWDDFYDNMLHPDDRESVESLFRSFISEERRGREKTLALNFRLKFANNGKYQWLEGQIIDINRNAKEEIAFVEGIIRNITREKEQALLLEEKERERQTAEAKARFFSTLSHELRTPMNIIQGMADMLSQTELDSRQSQRLEKLKEASDLLLNIIDDLLDFSQLEENRIILNEGVFSLTGALREVYQCYYNSALSKGLSLVLDLEKDLPKQIKGDRPRLIKALEKLVDNAIKFTPRGKVTLACHGGEEGRVLIEVRDEGIGIPPDKRELIFKPFNQIDDSHSRRHGGSGLGLAVCKQLVELMGGTVSLESRPGEGSVFTMDLPLKEADGKDKEKAVKVTYPGSRVLVVDDNPLNREIALDILKQAGVGTLTAEEGQEALEIMERDKPDLVFMDIQMPRMDGLTVSRLYREKEGPEEHLPIVAVTANSTEKDREMSYHAGMDGHLTKPLQIRRINRVLEKWLDSFRKEDILRDESRSGDEDAYPSLPGVAMEETLERFGGEYEIMVSLVKDFIDDYAAIGPILTELYRQGEQEELFRRLHALKGVSGSLGINDVFQSSQIIIQQYREKGRMKESELLRLINRLEFFCDRTGRFLEK